MKWQGVALTGLLVAGLMFAPARPLRPVQRLDCPQRGLSAVLDASGFILEPSGWGLAPSSWGRSGAMEPMIRVPPRRAGDRVRYERPGILEWHEARREGIEQAFEVLERPGGRGPLVVEQEVRGTLEVLNASAEGVVFGRSGSPLLAYQGLKAFDAAGRPLPARMRLKARFLALEVDDAGAEYPVSIDPLSTTANWVYEPNKANSNAANSVRLAGDVNGDGYSDFLMGMYGWDNAATDEGRAVVFHGGSSGLSTTVNWSVESDQTTCYFGLRADTAGDVNGDGYADVILTAPYYLNGETREGRAWAYHGSVAGLSTTAAWSFESNQASTEMGWAMGPAGDVNGDGYSDVIIGLGTYDNGATDEGRAVVFHGGSGGLSTTVNWSVESDQTNAYMGGTETNSAGDVNGDGFADVIVAAQDYSNGEASEGRCWVYHGGPNGLSTTAAWVAEGNQAVGHFGSAAATAGDVNGDGYSDVLVGASPFDNGQTDEGRAWIYHGSAAGLSTTAAWVTESDQASAFYGNTAHEAGDVNGDGYSDVVVGSYGWNNGQVLEGRAWVYHGGPNGLSTTVNWVVESNQASAYLSVTPAAVAGGDVNGDGFSDLMVGARIYSNGEASEGRCYVYHGGEGTVTRNTYDLPGARRFTETSDAGNAKLDKTGSRVVRDSSGFWYVVWQPALDLAGADILLSYTTTSTPSSAGDWSTITLVDGSGTGVITQIPANNKDGAAPALAMSSSDELHFVWNAWNDFKYYWIKCTNLSAITTASSWSTLRSIRPYTPTSNWHIDIALDSTDTPHVVFNIASGPNLVYTKSDTNGGAFSVEKTLVSAQKFFPKIAVDLDNNVYVIYHNTASPWNVSLLCSTNAYTTNPQGSIWKNLAQTTTDADVVNTPSTTMDAYTAADLCLDYNNICHVAWRVAPGNGAANDQHIAVRDGFIKEGWQAAPALLSTPGPWKRPVSMTAVPYATSLFSIANGGSKKDAVYVTDYTAQVASGLSFYHVYGTWGAATATSDLYPGASQAIWTERKPWRNRTETMWFLANDAKHRISTSWTDRSVVTAGWRPPTPTLNKVHPHFTWAFPNTRGYLTVGNSDGLIVSQTSKSAVYTLEGGVNTQRIYAADRTRGYLAGSASIWGVDSVGVLSMTAASVQSNVHLFLSGSTPDTANQGWLEAFIDDGTTLARDAAWINNPKFLTQSTSGYVLPALPITQSGARYLYVVGTDSGTDTKLWKFYADNGNTVSGFPVGSGLNYLDRGTEPVMRILNDQVFFPGNVSQIYRRESDGSGEIVSSVIPNVVKHLMMVRNSNRLFVAPQDSYVYDLTSGLKTTDWAGGRSADLGAAKTSGAYWTQSRDVIYVGVGNQLYRLNASTGSIQSNWPMATAGNLVTLPVAWTTFVYFGTDGGRLYAVNATSNVARANWPVLLDTTVATPVAKSIAFDGVSGHVYFTTDEGRVYKFSLE